MHPRTFVPDKDGQTDRVGRIAVAAARLGVWEYLPQEDRLFWSDRMHELHGLEPGQVDSISVAFARIHSEDREAVGRAWRKGLEEGGYEDTYRVILPDGRVRWLRVAGEMYAGSGKGPSRVVGVAWDVTAPRESERDALHRLGEIEAIYRSARIGLCVFDRDLRFLRINDRLAEINGHAAEAHLGRTVREMVPELADWAEGIARGIFETGEPALDLEVSGATAALPGEVRHWVEQWLPILDGHGRVRAINVVVEEVTERRRAEAELRRLADSLARSNRDLEQFAYVASHDLQEPLRTMRVFLQILESRHGVRLDGDARECVHMALQAGEQMQALIEGLLAYSRVQGQGRTPGPVSAGDCLDRALSGLAEVLTTSGARITREPLPEVLADPTQLAQVWQNLVGNAVKFRRPGTAPTIHVGAARDGDRWVLSVCDDGIGIPEANREKVFRIFQRLHHRDEIPGTGIGLSLCKSIVERHGGRIWVEDAEAGGTVFRFTLQAAPPRA